MNNQITLPDFYDHCRKQISVMNQRKGQFLMNQLSVHRPDLYSKIMKGNPQCDPFFDDNRIPLFWEFVVENWRIDNA